MRRFLSHIFPLLLMMLLASFLFFWKLGDTRLTNWDEAWYAAVSRTMAETGNVVTPFWNGQPFYEKPPLFYLLTALSYTLFGDREFSARFISALSGIATVAILYWFAHKQWGTLAAITSSLILLSTPVFLWRGRTGNLDSLLTFLIFLSAVTPRFAGLASGLAFLTKGAVGLLFPIIALRFKDLVWGTAISLAWFGLSYLMNGQLFIEQFFTQQGEKIGSIRTLFNNFSLDYFLHLKTGLKLWVFVLVPALFYSRKMLFSRFIVVFLLLISFLQEKSTWFLLPVYPFIALISGWFLSRWKKSIIFIIVIALFQLVYYRAEYFVPDVASDEARVAIASQEHTQPSDVVYLTHYYYPTAVYYSRRITYAVYSEQPSISWWILPKSAWSDILVGNRVFINTTQDEFKELQLKYSSFRFEVLFRSGDKLLLKKV